MCQATKHLSQDFHESKSGLTVHPPHVGLASVKNAISNPTPRDMEQYILRGQRMAWEKAHEIRTMMLLEAAVARCLDCVEGRAAHTALCKEQPPPQEPRDEDLTVPWRVQEVEFHTQSNCDALAEGQPIASSALPTRPIENAFDGDAATDSAWVAGCPQEGCPPGQWIGLLLEAPASFQCIRIYQASGSLLGNPFSEVLRIDRWAGSFDGWEPSRTFGAVNPLSGGQWSDLIVLPAEAKFSMQSLEWRLVSESSMTRHWAVAELSFFDNVECQFPVFGTASASGEAANRFATAAFDGQVDTFWWSQEAPGRGEAWLGLSFSTPLIIRCVQAVLDSSEGFRPESLQLQSRPEVDPRSDAEGGLVMTRGVFHQDGRNHAEPSDAQDLENDWLIWLLPPNSPSGGVGGQEEKKKERDPLDWEDDKFPKMADRPVEQAQIDPSYLAKMRQEAKKQYIEALGPDPAKVQRTWKFHFGICALENVTQNEWEVFVAVSETGNNPVFYRNDVLLFMLYYTMSEDD
eukprot:s209_g10.t1